MQGHFDPKMSTTSSHIVWDNIPSLVYINYTLSKIIFGRFACLEIPGKIVPLSKLF